MRLRNPFRTEAEAFRFVWLTIGYFALIVIAAAVNVWLGVAVFVVETVIIFFALLRGREDSPPVPASLTPRPPGERRILVIANETVGGPELLSAIKERAKGAKADVLVVSPALNSPLKHWVSDEDGARAAAQERLEESLAALQAAGIQAHGEIGDSEPLQAIADAVSQFSPDELVISTHPEGRSNWLEKGVVAGARERFSMPVTHVVVDLGVVDLSVVDPAEPAKPAASS